eukprot:1021971-Rhodomonas_salina.2
MKMDANGTTVRPDTRKGKLAVNKSSEDGLMHLTWTDRSGGGHTSFSSCSALTALPLRPPSPVLHPDAALCMSFPAESLGGGT